LPTHPHHRQVKSAPRIGEDSIQILQQAGIDEAKIEQLLASGVVLQAKI
jgi:crotonobetainyl-CoA:carnitine CoA-transferase CaiB-like acyl-CoA transferase